MGGLICFKTFVAFLIYVVNFRARKKDKLRYRYPRGESYLDVIQRYVVYSCNLMVNLSH